MHEIYEDLIVLLPTSAPEVGRIFHSTKSDNHILSKRERILREVLPGTTFKSEGKLSYAWAGVGAVASRRGERDPIVVTKFELWNFFRSSTLRKK